MIPARCGGLLALVIDLAVSDLVPARLPRPGAIPVDLAGHFERIRSVHIDEELHRLLARPALRMETGVDHQTAGAEGEGLEEA